MVGERRSQLLAKGEKPEADAAKERLSAIWLEVVEVRLDHENAEAVPVNRIWVQLKGDREHPKPWWPVDGDAKGSNALETYRLILNEIDKKRTVLARLSCDEAKGLHCDAFRFQSSELGTR